MRKDESTFKYVNYFTWFNQFVTTPSGKSYTYFDGTGMI